MLHILIPTDFSILALRSAEYALMLAQNIEARFTLLHIDNVPRPNYAFIKKVDDILRNEALKTLREQAESIKKSTGFTGRVDVAYEHGDAVSGIEEYTKHHRVDLVIMGTKGESVIKNRLFGSVAAGVLEHVTVPSLFVPVDAPTVKPRNIAFATDLTNLDEELPELIAFARFFNATVHVLHIYPDNVGADTFDEERTKIDLLAKTQYPNLTFNAVMDTDIIAGIDRFMASDSPDMLAMFTYKSGILSYLFDTSYTEEMTFHSRIPLLIFRKHKVDE